MLKKLVSRILNNQDKKKIKSILTDGVYDLIVIFKYLQEKKPSPAIEVRRNLIISSKTARLRYEVDMLDLKDFLSEKGIESTEVDGWPKLSSHLSRECLVSAYMPHGFLI